MFWWILLAVAAALVLAAAYYCYRLAFYNANDRTDDPMRIPPGEQYAAVSEKMTALVREVQDAPFESVSITSFDGTVLAGRLYQGPEGAPVLIQMHGYRGNAVREFCGGWQLAKELQCHTLVVDQRGHGSSGGHTISFGVLERYDCREWVRFVIDRFGKATPIILSGISMGAATVLMASELQLPGNVKAILADCPYSSPGAIIRKVCRDAKIPGWLGWPFVALGGLIFGRFCLWSSSAVKAVRNTEIPIHLIHGEADLFVPCDMSREILDAAAGKCSLYTVAGAGHGISYLVDPEGYTRSVMKFIKGHL